MFDFLIYKPFSWLLIQFYSLTNSYVAAIVLFALAAKLVLLYFMARGKLSTMRMQRLQPKIQEIQKKCGADKQKLNEETMKLYQREGVSPMGGCVWMLLPLPVLFALYAVIREPLHYLMNFPGNNSTEIMATVTEKLSALGIPEVAKNDGYPQLTVAQWIHDNFQAVQSVFSDITLRDINFSFSGINLSQIPNLPWSGGFSLLFLIPLISAATAYLSFWVSTKMSRMPQTQQTKMMALISPAISLWFGFVMPAAMSVYWITNNILSVAQEYFLTRHFNKVLDVEDAHKAELEEKRRIAEEKQKEEDRIRRAEKIAQQKKHTGKYKLKKKP